MKLRKTVPGVMFLGLMLYAAGSYALSPVAVEGKTLYPACHVCHNTAMDPPLGPPMWGVKRQYKNNTMDDEDFIKTMVEFVKAPSKDKAIHVKAVEQLGLMPAMPLPDEMLSKIAIYILEENFPPPCDHWRIAVKRAEARGDAQHANRDRMMLERFCD